MANGWNLWLWLECISEVTECCCKEVNRFIITPLVLALFLQQHPTSLFILKMFFCSLSFNLLQIHLEA